VSPEGIVLAVARGMIELRLVLDADERAYAERVRDTIASRILDEKLLAGPFPLPEPPGTDTAALVITDEGATFTERLTPGADAVQLRLKTKSIIPGESATCWAYDDPLGERIVRIRTEAPAFTSEQYWRVLEV
jgi:hypothetical protein